MIEYNYMPLVYPSNPTGRLYLSINCQGDFHFAHPPLGSSGAVPATAEPALVEEPLPPAPTASERDSAAPKCLTVCR